MSARATVAFAALVCGMTGTAMAGTWSDLWSTHDQQGQRLLESNHPGAAAQVFSDPKRRAYAELQARQYAKAADLLAPLKDADSQYNRGNALAHSGKLTDALAAYDKALASSPGNKDVLRNRELVAKALEDQQHSQQGKDGSSGKNGKGQQGQSNGSGNKQSGDEQSGGKDGKAGQAGQQSQAGSQGQNGSQSQANAQNQPGQQDQQGQQAQNGQRGQQGQQGQGQPASQQQASGQAGTGNQSQPNNPAQSANASANPAQGANPRDANAAQSANPQQAANTSASGQQQAANAASASQPGQNDDRSATALQQGQTSGTGTQRAPANMAESPLVKGAATGDAQQTQPRSEQALALDQWMRSIPEDSGELLRRKFQIEHLMKQQGNQP